ncbi:Pectin lyase fold/virulence factor [Pseudocohnilembus persalinus]|uniref:Pectin lyase fold/virulence factor n=1 Tax=Pseudocohnilembus persalinus TaxID=266149 RepID=A0A0V0Q8X5_PSEPJ|nr:Pectin lyase fold/virulence factor [Pseudocohnilembus persalinus]|eukprot:KRW98685.1 Pectin lyase fold/virulence factor [Pseudocohnilembus persalinus]
MKKENYDAKITFNDENFFYFCDQNINRNNLPAEILEYDGEILDTTEIIYFEEEQCQNFIDGETISVYFLFLESDKVCENFKQIQISDKCEQNQDRKLSFKLSALLIDNLQVYYDNLLDFENISFIFHEYNQVQIYNFNIKHPVVLSFLQVGSIIFNNIQYSSQENVQINFSLIDSVKIFNSKFIDSISDENGNTISSDGVLSFVSIFNTQIVNCTFMNNQNQLNSASSIRAYNNYYTLIENCQFQNNVAFIFGGIIKFIQ